MFKVYITGRHVVPGFTNPIMVGREEEFLMKTNVMRIELVFASTCRGSSALRQLEC